MPTKIMTRLLAGTALSALLAGVACAAEARPYDIPPQDAATALQAYAMQSGRQVLFPYEAARGKPAPAVQGEYSDEQALAMLASSAGLRVTADDGRTVTLRPQLVRAEEGGAGGEVDALIVTAQKREEAIQDVPIAISAFTQKSLEEQKIEGGFDLVKAIPNVTFSKNNFSGYNFSIRGIGTKAISVTTDPGVAVSFNNTTLIRNRLFEQEYFDVERVEVLRGPQGTLFGRNATSGVINVISAKPKLGEFEASIKGELGNYDARRAVAMVNVPIIEDKLALRVAGSWTQRSGYNINLFDDEPTDGRDLWSARVTLGFELTERLRGELIWERFEEDDDRSRTGKQLCTHDDGPPEIGGVSLEGASGFTKGYFSQGCLPGSLYDDATFGTPNGNAMPFILALQNFAPGTLPDGTFATFIPRGVDPYGGLTQSRNLREFYSSLTPIYRAKADILNLNFNFDISDSLHLTSQAVYNKDEIYSSQDFNRYTTLPILVDSSVLLNIAGDEPSRWRDLTPGGVFCDPQVGCSNTIVGRDLSRANSTQFSQEFRLQSSFDGPINFNIGVNYTDYKTVEDYYVFNNLITLTTIFAVNSAGIVGGSTPSKYTINPDCSALGTGFFEGLPDGFLCAPIENNALENIQDIGHNYFLSRNPYQLKSGGIFGEIYWSLTPDLKITAGLRYTDDKKTFTPVPSQTLLSDPTRLEPYAEAGRLPPTVYQFPMFSFASGYYPSLPAINLGWKEFTGRLGVDWKPVLSFTDQTMLYAFYSRGYKGGGMNPPLPGLNYEALEEAGTQIAPSAPPLFRPEFVNAFEIGAKNTLFSGGLVLNLTGFYYDYKDYQVSKIVDRSAQNENFDATIWGLELETLWSPTRDFRVNMNLGYLNTKMADGSQSIDTLNRTAGHDDWVIVKPAMTLTSNCIAPAVHVAAILANDLPSEVAGSAASGLCPGGTLLGDSFRPGGSFEGVFGITYDPRDHPEANYGAGFFTDVSGNELPNSPHWTATLGAQKSWELIGGWKATLRGDAYWQAQSWARIYQLPIDKLHAWGNANVSLKVENRDVGLEVEFYVKNITNEAPITDTFTNSDDTALTTNIFVLDPRLIGFWVRKNF